MELEYAPLYDAPGLGLTTWSPLSSGLFSGKYSGGSLPEGSRLSTSVWLRDMVLSEAKLAAADAVVAVAQELGCTSSQLAIAWCVSNPNVSTVITGATRMSQLEENLGALAVVPLLTPEVRARLEAAVAAAGDLE